VEKHQEWYHCASLTEQRSKSVQKMMLVKMSSLFLIDFPIGHTVFIRLLAALDCKPHLNIDYLSYCFAY